MEKNEYTCRGCDANCIDEDIPTDAWGMFCYYCYNMPIAVNAARSLIREIIDCPTNGDDDSVKKIIKDFKYIINEPSKNPDDRDPENDEMDSLKMLNILRENKLLFILNDYLELIYTIDKYYQKR